MNAAAFILSVINLVLIIDRLRQINWRTTRWPYVLMYICYALTHYGVIYRSLVEGVTFYAILFVLGQLCWLSVTHSNWREGVPREARTGHGNLGPPEFESQL
jgi:hypothetical protein